MPDYLYTVRGMTLWQIGAFSWIPFLMGDFGSLSGGWISGLLISPASGDAGLNKL
jgi:hypothetical protein